MRKEFTFTKMTTNEQINQIKKKFKTAINPYLLYDRKNKCLVLLSTKEYQDLNAYKRCCYFYEVDLKKVTDHNKLDFKKIIEYIYFHYETKIEIQGITCSFNNIIHVKTQL